MKRRMRTGRRGMMMMTMMMTQRMEGIQGDPMMRIRKKRLGMRPTREKKVGGCC